jgi:hypothetical protein
MKYSIKHPVSFGILFATLVLTALLTVALHSFLAWLAVINLGLIVALRVVSHAEGDGRLDRWIAWVKSWMDYFLGNKSVG